MDIKRSWQQAGRVFKCWGEWVVSAEISEIKPNSLASKAGLRAGDRIISINGRELRDILDYELASSDTDLEIEIQGDLEYKKVRIKNLRYEPIGISFDTSLFNGIKTCRNKCVFCFVDQLPRGMRDAVYVKDDDYRLSFLYGNFVTLTNADEKDIDRIIEDRISPLYVSLHATDAELRARMLGRKKCDNTLEHVQKMSEAGIEMHIQIVLCPGFNDGKQLDKTLDDLGKYDGVASVGIVPVGLTGHRVGLHVLRSFEKQEIIELILQVENRQRKAEKERGDSWVYLADEFYIVAERDLPPSDHYGDYPQIENGIGLSRLFIDDANEQIDDLIAETERRGNDFDASAIESRPLRAIIASGELFAPLLNEVVSRINEEIINNGCNELSSLRVVGIKNRYFGGKVTVTGLLTGYDIVSGVIENASEKNNNNREEEILIIPDMVLNADGLLLDGSTPELIAEKLNMRVKVIRSMGAEAVRGIVEAIKSGDGV